MSSPSKIPDWLRICASKAIIGEIYPEIRVICLGYKNRTVTVRVYFDREPTEYDHDAVDIICLQMETQCPEQYDHIDVECFYSETPLGHLDKLDGTLYARREWDD